MIRVAFCVGVKSGDNLFLERAFEFAGLAGTTLADKQRNVASFHTEISSALPKARTLEVSTKSDNALGVQLSAFNMKVTLSKHIYCVESIFQGSKQFAQGGPFHDLAHRDPLDAKRDPRLKSSGALLGFRSPEGFRFPADGTSNFYDFLYLSALLERTDLLASIATFDVFTDIEFPKTKIGFVRGRPFNSQARSCAIAATLFRRGEAAELHRYIENLVSVAQAPKPDEDNYLF